MTPIQCRPPDGGRGPSRSRCSPPACWPPDAAPASYERHSGVGRLLQRTAAPQPGTPRSTAHAGSARGRRVAPAPATPVPTVSGGRVAAGEPACVGWPANAPSAAPAGVLRPGERGALRDRRAGHPRQGPVGRPRPSSAPTAASAGLVNALRRPAGTRAARHRLPRARDDSAAGRAHQRDRPAADPPRPGYRLRPRPVPGARALQSLHWTRGVRPADHPDPRGEHHAGGRPSATVVGPARARLGPGRIQPQRSRLAAPSGGRPEYSLGRCRTPSVR